MSKQSQVKFTFNGWELSASSTPVARRYPHVLRLALHRGPLARSQAVSIVPPSWYLPASFILKKLRPQGNEEFENETAMYSRLQTLQGSTIPILYGEGRCSDDGNTPALLLSDAGGVDLYHDSSLLGMEREEMEASIRASYRPMVSLGIAYDDWKLDNFRLVDGKKVVILDLESTYDLDFDQERALWLGVAALMEKWKHFRRARQSNCFCPED